MNKRTFLTLGGVSAVLGAGVLVRFFEREPTASKEKTYLNARRTSVVETFSSLGEWKSTGSEQAVEKRLQSGGKIRIAVDGDGDKLLSATLSLDSNYNGLSEQQKIEAQSLQVAVLANFVGVLCVGEDEASWPDIQEIIRVSQELRNAPERLEGCAMVWESSVIDADGITYVAYRATPIEL